MYLSSKPSKVTRQGSALEVSMSASVATPTYESTVVREPQPKRTHTSTSTVKEPNGRTRLYLVAIGTIHCFQAHPDFSLFVVQGLE